MAFDETKRATTVLLLNLMPEQLQSVQERIKDKALQLLFIHPMLVPTLVMDILFTEIVEKGQVLYEEWRQAIKKGALVEGLYMTSEFESIDIKQEASAAHRSSFKISWIKRFQRDMQAHRQAVSNPYPYCSVTYVLTTLPPSSRSAPQL